MARVLLLLLWIVTASARAEGVYSDAGPDGPAQTAYAPESGKGPVVIVISGSLGQNHYQGFAGDVSRLGYYTVLINGNDILTKQQDGAANLRKTIERAQKSPNAVKGKAAVVGLSQGGGGALVYASSMEDLVSAVVAYYPAVSFLGDAGILAQRFKVPVLVLAGGQDRFNNCCLIESMRAMEKASAQLGASFQLVVYPDAGHSFNMFGANFRKDDERDAWHRTVEMLKKHQPLATSAFADPSAEAKKAAEEVARICGPLFQQVQELKEPVERLKALGGWQEINAMIPSEELSWLPAFSIATTPEGSTYYFVAHPKTAQCYVAACGGYANQCRFKKPPEKGI